MTTVSKQMEFGGVNAVWVKRAPFLRTLAHSVIFSSLILTQKQRYFSKSLDYFLIYIRYLTYTE